MKKNLRYLAGAAMGVVAALGFTSCAYDPYYSSTSVGGSYNSGYGDGYGYGGSTFSTSIFVGTGDPRWGYDPYTYSYYDYHRRCYYDPYLNGYYPIGYRPTVVYGVPHPYGWRPGRGYIRPPGRIYNGNVSNYRDRAGRYRSSNYGWAKQVRPGPAGVQGQRPSQSSYDRKSNQNSNVRPNTGSRPAANQYGRESQTRNQNSPSARQSSRPAARQENNSRPQSRYNTPVSDPRTQARQGQRNNAQNRQQAQQNAQRPAQRGNTKQNSKADEDDKRVRGYR